MGRAWSDLMKLLFVGDFFYSYDIVKEDILEISNWINENGYRVVLNLEGPLAKNDRPIKKRGLNLCQSDLTIEILKKLNVVGVCLANNHMMDYGADGLKKTIELLDKNGIMHTGAGKNLEEAIEPIKLTKNGKQIVIQNFGWEVEETVYATLNTAGCAPRDEEIILSNTKRLKEIYPDSVIINVLHWGFEYNLLPMPVDIKLAHDMVEAGCDLVIGHHPHNVQPYEIYKNKYIFYSLGNFYFSSQRDEYSEIRFPTKTIDVCNYGAMVVLDTNNMNIDYDCCIYYDPKSKSSVVKKMDPEILLDITNEDFVSKEYVSKAREGSINNNPILTLDAKKNDKLLARLMLSYNIAQKLKGLRKNKLGKRIYELLKLLNKRLMQRG